jgi:penicillin-binding protein 2
MLPKRQTAGKNKIFFFVLSFALVFVIIFNLVSLQIVKGGDYYFQSKNTYSLYSMQRAQRGVIYDRNGIQLVENVPKYKVFIERKDEPTEDLTKTIENLTKLSNANVQDLYTKEYERIKGYKNITDVKIFGNLDYNPYIFQIEANPDNYPLIKVEKYTQRKYLYPELTSHILGYTGEINAEDYETGKYNYGDEIGKFGIEKGYDNILRGQNGLVQKDLYRSENKNITSVVKPVINGQDIYLTIDIEYQKKLYQLIKTAKDTNRQFKDTNSFGVVAQDVNNGQILAMASYPNFDSNLFTGGISDQAYQVYLNDPGKPLSNKATQYSQAPGSTFKLLTDVAALSNNAITKNTIFSTGGTFKFGGVNFVDAGRVDHGDINMIKALCVSSNIYHMKAALALDEKTKNKGAETINELFEEIGLDELSGINIGTESTGYFPTPEKHEAAGKDWFTGFLLNSSIGQGEVKMSPIESTKMVSTIASKGKVVKQSILLQPEQQQEVTQLNVNPSVFKDIDEGMRCATDLNNGYIGAKNKPLPEISIKTGSAETGQLVKGVETVHGWEVSYAPSSNPKVSMSIFMENAAGGWKGGYISREFYKYLQDSGKL